MQKSRGAREPEPPARDGNGGGLVLAPGERVRLSDQLYGQIFEQIVSGRLAVGAQLPSENEICEQFGVSRPVVREALLRLKADGLVATQQGRGSFVIHQPADRIRSFAKAQDVAGYLRCLEVRIALEGDAARLAAQRRTEEQMEAIEAAHQRFVDTAETGKLDPAVDLAFHARIAEASGNSFYLDVLDAIHESIAGFMRLTLNLTRTGSRQRAARVVDEHAAIVAALREQDPERARVAMQFHLTQARQRLVDRSRDR
jgi:GntR family transcriptional repressor for pyruvate dehydrogenase complex